VFLLPDAEVPLVRGTLLMRGGQYASPPDKVRWPRTRPGLRRLTCAALRCAVPSPVGQANAGCCCWGQDLQRRTCSHPQPHSRTPASRPGP
jgi:hypothetical protein